MEKKVTNNIKLGIFVLAGLLFLILVLYMIGKNRNLFGSTYILKTRFENTHGLVSGNNVRFSGIEAGSVKSVRILNDTVIEVTMLIDTKMKKIIRKDALVSITTDGLVGNKVVNIEPSRLASPLADPGDILPSKKGVDTDEMLETLHHTNNDVAVVAAELKKAVQRVNSSTALWSVLNDETIPRNLKATMSRFRSAGENINGITAAINEIVADVQNGKGTLGAMLKDSSIAINIDRTIIAIHVLADRADSMVREAKSIVSRIHSDFSNNNGAVQTLLRDTAVVKKLQESLENIETGTKRFDEVMEALKHNFLLRGYFRKQQKQTEN